MGEVTEKDFKEYTDKFDKFVRQYNLDMRGDNNSGEGARFGLVDNVRELYRIQKTYPSLTYLFAHKPLPTIAVTIGLFLILYGSLAYGILTMLGAMLGIDVSQVPPTH